MALPKPKMKSYSDKRTELRIKRKDPPQRVPLTSNSNHISVNDKIKFYGIKKGELKKNDLNYERVIVKKIGILIVNYNNLNYTRNCILDLKNQINNNFDLWIVDQNSSEKGTLEFLNVIEKEGVIVVRNKNNLDLNKVWNFFYENCSLEYLCFLNNDVRLTNNFTDDIHKIFATEKTVGAVIHVTNNPQYINASHKLKYEILSPPLYQGWDFCLRRDVYKKIPDTLKIFGGDDFLFGYVVKKNYKIALSYSSPIIHFKEKTRNLINKNDISEIQKKDAENYWKEVNKHKLTHVASTYHTHRSNRYAPEGIKLTQNKNCIFTALIGDYDLLGTSTIGKQTNWDYICFTDNKNLKSDFWKIVYIENNGISQLDNYKLARKIKTTFFERLSSYDYLIWKDARMIINKNLNEYLKKLGENNDILFVKNPLGNSIKIVYENLLKGKLETKEMIERIKERYKNLGYNYNNDLISSGVMLFKNNNKTIKFFSEWWDEIKNFSHRDQLSGNFVLSKNSEIKYKYLSCSIALGLNAYFNRGQRITERLSFK